MLAGPPDTGECRVEQPTDGSCDALRLEAESRGVTPWYRDGGCVYDGRRVATSSQATSALCTDHCLSDSRCLYWTFNFASGTCTLYDSAERTCSTSYAPSNLSPEDCFPSVPADTGKVRILGGLLGRILGQVLGRILGQKSCSVPYIIVWLHQSA